VGAGLALRRDGIVLLQRSVATRCRGIITARHDVARVLAGCGGIAANIFCLAAYAWTLRGARGSR